MTGIINPKTTFSIIPAEQIVRLGEQKVLIVGQKLASGTAPAGELVEDIPNDGSEDTLFGAKSHIAGMVRAFKRDNKVTRLDALPLDEVTGQTHSDSAIFINTATALKSGILTVSIGSENDHVYSVSVVKDELAQAIADKIKSEIDADLEAPFTQETAPPDSVLIQSSANGVVHNDWDLRVIENTADLAIGLTAWSDATGLPTIPDLSTVLGEIRYQTVVWPSALDLSPLETLLNTRFNYENIILDGVGIQAKKGTLSELKTYADQNSQSIVIVANKSVNEADRKGTAIPEMPDIIASEMAAVRSLRLSTDALLTNYITSTASLDQYGGISLASLPYFNTRLPNIKTGLEQDTWIQEDQDELIDNGVSLIGPNLSFTEVIFGTQVTTYLTNTINSPDDSYHFLNTVDTGSVIREFFFNNCRYKYAQTRLTDGDLVPERDFANAGSIRAFLNELYDELADDGLVQKGRAAKKDFNDNLIITVDMVNGKVTINMAPLLVTQIRVILGTIQINFG
jgi:phage tail sheath gpL-like